MEKAGIPTVRFGFWDQKKYFERTALLNNVPQLRWVTIERTGTPDKRLYPIVPDLLAALTDPLTDEEKYVGTYVPEKPQRYIFEGTHDEAIEFTAEALIRVLKTSLSH